MVSSGQFIALFLPDVNLNSASNFHEGYCPPGRVIVKKQKGFKAKYIGGRRLGQSPSLPGSWKLWDKFMVHCKNFKGAGSSEESDFLLIMRYISERMVWKAFSTFVASSADVSMNERPSFSA